MKMTLPMATEVIVGNAQEAGALANALGFGADAPDLATIARRVGGLLDTSGAARVRLVVITCGKDPTHTFDGATGACQTWPVIVVERSQIVDTCGAGDAFVGGFLSGLIPFPVLVF